jgi:hypothetical protein
VRELKQRELLEQSPILSHVTNYNASRSHSIGRIKMTTLTINGKESGLTFIEEDTDIDALLAPYMNTEETMIAIEDDLDFYTARHAASRGSVEFKDKKLAIAMRLYERQRSLGYSGDRQIAQIAERTAEIFFDLTMEECALLMWVPEIDRAIREARIEFRLRFEEIQREANCTAMIADVDYCPLSYSYTSISGCARRRSKGKNKKVPRTNEEKFLAKFALEIEKEVDKAPHKFRWYSQNNHCMCVEEFAGRMTRSLKAGNACKDSPAVKRACKALKIKHEYGAIAEYLNS